MNVKHAALWKMGGAARSLGGGGWRRIRRVPGRRSLQGSPRPSSLPSASALRGRVLQALTSARAQRAGFGVDSKPSKRVASIKPYASEAPYSSKWSSASYS
ncbi:hypothetical protein AAFF_G00036560 [Aldrovandia affinis]|uniref:Uncharacterized protein n=1 Tax=Aldrovandia affinis TaxID=143900 RepID=A0AAD7S386_9TELE|nr:hypothetical protein AAFF_G00036560 [Aldrovandia affinis]